MTQAPIANPLRSRRSAAPARSPTLALALTLALPLPLFGAGCGGAPVVEGGGDAGAAASPDLGAAPAPDLARPPDLAPAVDPCTYANLGDGTYCGGNLMEADADTLYVCQGKATASATRCPNGCHKAPRGVPDSCEPEPPGSRPDGKGVWIWTFARNAGPPAEIAKKCKDYGIGFVLIKSGEDTATYTTNWNAAIVAEFTSRGIQVFGWPYVRPGNIAAKVSAIADQARVPGISGIILDVEGEFNDRGADATALCSGIRKAVPGVFLGYTSFGWVSYHLNFPYREFDTHCGDAFLPQTYWDLWTTGPVGGLAKGTDGYRAIGGKAPIWPAQDNYNGASVADMNKFFDAAGPRASLWRWPDPARTDLLSQLPKLNWKN